MPLENVPVAFTLGLGVAFSGGNDTPGPELRVNPVVDARVAFGVTESVALGLRLRGTHDEFEYADTAPVTLDRFRLYSVDVAGTVEIELSPRLTFMPWLGMHFAFGHASYLHDMDRSEQDLSPDSAITYGALIGGHVVTDPRYRVTIYLEAQNSSEAHLTGQSPMKSYRYSALTLGTTVRF